jgi:Protein of unknown function (DUF3181)
MANPTETIESLAAEIGDRVYMDIAKWHLFLENAKLHKTLAERLYPLLTENPLPKDRVLQILQSIPIPIGGGRREIPLADFLPAQCQTQLMDLLEEFQRDL